MCKFNKHLQTIAFEPVRNLIRGGEKYTGYGWGVGGINNWLKITSHNSRT